MLRVRPRCTVARAPPRPGWKRETRGCAASVAGKGYPWQSSRRWAPSVDAQSKIVQSPAADATTTATPSWIGSSKCSSTRPAGAGSASARGPPAAPGRAWAWGFRPSASRQTWARSGATTCGARSQAALRAQQAARPRQGVCSTCTSASVLHFCRIKTSAAVSQALRMSRLAAATSNSGRRPRQMSTSTPSARMWSISVWDGSLPARVAAEGRLPSRSQLLPAAFCEASGHLETLVFRERAYSLVTAFRDPPWPVSEGGSLLAGCDEHRRTQALFMRYF